MKTRNIVAISSFFCSLLIVTPATAQDTANIFIEKIAKDSTTYLLYLRGLQEGLSWANADLLANEKQAIYCVPGRLALNPQQTADILTRYVEAHKFLGDGPVGSALLFALKDTFPCGPTPD